jgi:hypothetical protein
MTKGKKSTDVNVLASQILAEATEQPQDPAPSPAKEKNPAAVALGRLGGLKGGPSRKDRLSKERRIEIAKKAAETRWSKK